MTDSNNLSPGAESTPPPPPSSNMRLYLEIAVVLAVVSLFSFRTFTLTKERDDAKKEADTLREQIQETTRTRIVERPTLVGGHIAYIRETQTDTSRSEDIHGSRTSSEDVKSSTALKVEKGGVALGVGIDLLKPTSRQFLAQSDLLGPLGCALTVPSDFSGIQVYVSWRL